MKVIARLQSNLYTSWFPVPTIEKFDSTVAVTCNNVIAVGTKHARYGFLAFDFHVKLIQCQIPSYECPVQ